MNQQGTALETVLESADRQMSLRPLRAQDAAGPYLDWMNDPDVTQFLESRFRAHTREDLVAYIEQQNADPNVLFMAIMAGHPQRHVGNIKLGPIDPFHKTAEIGVMIGDRSQWGKGIATQAIRMLSEHALGSLGLAKVMAQCYSDNMGSARAFERAGFTIEGRRPSHYQSGDQRVDQVLMGRLSEPTRQEAPA